MLRSLRDLAFYTVSATDGDVGSVVDFLLDDERWTIRYLVVETSDFRDKRQVLISPISFRRAEWSIERFHLALTMKKVKNSPRVNVGEPVSRQRERDYDHYYGYSCYWGHPGLWGMGARPGLLAAGRGTEAPVERSNNSNDVHLRSAAKIRGYHIQGSEEAIGHVEDFIVDDETWEVRYLVIDTSSGWLGKKVLVAPHWANRISWENRKVYVNMSRQAIESSPKWDGTAAVSREYEARLYDYHARPAYWASGVRRVAAAPPHSEIHRMAETRSKHGVTPAALHSVSPRTNEPERRQVAPR